MTNLSNLICNRFDIINSQFNGSKPFDLGLIETEDEEPSHTIGTSSLNSTKTDYAATGVGSKTLHCKHTFKGHNGAIYCVQWSPCGRYIASGSFDKTIKVWDVSSETEYSTLNEHLLNITDVQWTNDSGQLITGGYDNLVKLWDIVKSKCLFTATFSGFVQTVAINNNNNNLIAVGTTSKEITLIDKRQMNSVYTIMNDTMINTLQFNNDGNILYSGDYSGKIKLWDIRKSSSECMYQYLIDNNNNNNNNTNTHTENKVASKPISFIHFSKIIEDGQQQFLAVNCYDNSIRIFDNTNNNNGNNNKEFKLTTHCTITGVKTKNYPIRSSFYSGNLSDSVYHSVGYDKDIDEELNNIGKENNGNIKILASGSADNFVHLFKIDKKQQGSFTQLKLEGHKERVYATHWHPKEPLLASCSADSTIKLWCT